MAEIDRALKKAIAMTPRDGVDADQAAAIAAGGVTKKAFKALMLQLQRSVPREQEVLKDLDTLRGR